MFPIRRLLRFDLITFIMGFLLVMGLYALIFFLLWMAFHDSGPPGS